MKQVECILFDCDGTLVDSELLNTQAYINVLKSHGIEISVKSALMQYKGLALSEIIQRIEYQWGTDLSAEAIKHDCQSEVIRLFRENLTEIPGARELLSRIKVPVCVVSNSSLKKIQFSLELTNMLHFFGDNIVSGPETGKYKPSPDILYYAAELMKVPADRCILIEDSETGVMAGRSAGIDVFWYSPKTKKKKNPEALPGVTPFSRMSQLTALWLRNGWYLT